MMEKWCTNDPTTGLMLLQLGGVVGRWLALESEEDIYGKVLTSKTLIGEESNHDEKRPMNRQQGKKANEQNKQKQNVK